MNPILLHTMTDGITASWGGKSASRNTEQISQTQVTVQETTPKFRFAND
jgi:hypothetical protein